MGVRYDHVLDVVLYRHLVQEIVCIYIYIYDIGLLPNTKDEEHLNHVKWHMPQLGWLFFERHIGCKKLIFTGNKATIQRHYDVWLLIGF